MQQPQQAQADAAGCKDTALGCNAAALDDLASSAGDAAVTIDGPRRSIYDLWSPRRRTLILLTSAFASILVPFSDTVYLPAMAVIQQDLRTSQQLVSASVSLYMVAVGLSALVVGPASDRFGRLPIYMASCAAFIGASLGCIFAPSAGVLVAFRALQGAGIAAFMTSGTSCIADVFAPAVRGAASGVFMVPLLIGPVIGPLLGGGLSQAFGWRSTFIALALFGALCGVAIVALVPETHQYIVLRRLARRDAEGAKAIQEYGSVMAHPPVFSPPWMPLKYLFDRLLRAHALTALVCFATMFSTLTELPVALAEPPYSLSTGLIGVCFLADGLAGLVGSPLGGSASDRAANAQPAVPQARLLPNTVVLLALQPAGLLLYGWALQAHLHLAVVLLALVLTGFACAFYLPGQFAFVTTQRQSVAGAASAAVQSMMFVTSGVMIQVSAAAVRGMGFGAWFTVLAALQALVAGVAMLSIRREQRAAAHLPAAPQGGER